MSTEIGEVQTGAYVTDKQEQYVQDAATDAIANANQTICFIANIRADAMVNKGHYVALVDSNACRNAGGNASQSSSTASVTATNYDQHSATVTRVDNNSPQILKGHVQMTADDGKNLFAIYTHGSNTIAPTTALPNGEFYLDYAGFLRTAAPDNKQSGDKYFRGNVAAAATGITMSETGFWGSTRLYSKGNTDSGSGIVENTDNSKTPPTIGTYNFGYNSRYFCRDVRGEKCFDRSIANANISVWRYGLYDNTGKQFDISNPSFDIKDANGGYGHASYWGIWTNATQTDDMQLTNQKDPSIHYTLKKSGGRLWKHTKNNVTLDNLKNNSLQFYVGMPSLGSPFKNNTFYEAYWNGTDFKLTNEWVGGYMTTLNPVITINPSDLSTFIGGYGLYGWSQSLGGSFAIPSATLAAGTGPVSYETNTTVSPGDSTVPTSLKCVNNCPTQSTIDTANTSLTENAFTFGTQNKWGNTALSDVVSYTWNPANYSLTASGGSALAYPLLPLNINPQYQWGVQSGALVAATEFTTGGSMDCDGAGTTFCDYKLRGLAEYTYYTFETGQQDWNKPAFLKKNSDLTYVTFSPPLDATYSVPDTAAYGQSRGATMHLQFNGFGDLQGIPGKCISPADNTEVSCGPTTTWVSAFSIPTGDTVTINDTIYYVKWLNRQVNFKVVAGIHSDTAISTYGNIDMCGGCVLPAAMVLTGDVNDPSVSANAAAYSGPYDNVDFSLKPAVIQGVVQ